MKYTFHCKACHKITLCDSKEEVEELKKKHFTGSGRQKRHVPALQTMHIETRTSGTNRPYLVLVAD